MPTWESTRRWSRSSRVPLTISYVWITYIREWLYIDEMYLHKTSPAECERRRTWCAIRHRFAPALEQGW